MTNFNGILIVLAVTVFFCFYGQPAVGQIYKWVDENGVVTYSNVAPPEDESDVGVIEETEKDESAPEVQDAVAPAPSAEVSQPAAETSPSEEAKPDDDPVRARVRDAHKKVAYDPSQEKEPTPEEMEVLEEAAQEEHIKAKPLRKKYLTQRIEDTKRSIEELRKQIKRRPNDESLRRSMALKKEFLRKYVEAERSGNY